MDPQSAVWRRASLCVPGDRPERHAKAFATGADEVVLDLEDAVAPEHKDTARAAVLATIASGDWRDRTLAIRVNADRPADLEAIAAIADAPTGLTVVLPKIETPEQVIEAARVLAGTGIGLQALIETPRGSAAAFEIAASDPSLVGLIIGYADLGAELHRRGPLLPPARWLVHQERVLGAARAHHLQAIDGPFLGIGDEAGLVTACRLARDLGFDGKWAIHPRQVDVITRIFTPRDSAFAERVALALADGRGVAIVDGVMVDEAHLRGLRAGPQDESPNPRYKRGAGSDRAPRERHIGPPYGDDLKVGDEFAGPGLTLDSGLQALHRAICGDRLPLALDAALAERVTGSPAVLAHPSLVADVVVGQSTDPSGRVLGNLFYRGVTLTPVSLGTTVRTRARVAAIEPTRDGRKAKVTLSMQAFDARGREIASGVRCPLLPVRHAVVLDGQIPESKAVIHVPDWDLSAHPQGEALVSGDSFVVEAAETVTGATELARATLNLAMTHTDGEKGAHGQRLVYGGHVMAIGFAHACRALPGLMTVLAWRSGDHLGPTSEGDRLTTRVDVQAVDGPVVDLRIRVSTDAAVVLDWVIATLYAG